MIPTWGAAFGANAIFNSAEYRADLTHSAVPDKAAPGTTATFTRATTKTWPNNDGYLVTGVSGEIGFVGARRVRNLIPLYSQDLTKTAQWTPTGTASVSSSTVALFPANNDYILCTDPTGKATKTVGNKYIFSFKVSGSGTLDFYLNDGVGETALRVTLTSTPTVYSISRTAVAGGDGLINCYFGRVGSTATSVTVDYVQLEDVTAQTTQTAGEYVSVGVESAPYYHGSMVDGVKCFPTDLSGNPIPSTTLLGYQAEGARTNLCLQSNAFTTTWTKDATLTLTQNAVGPDGATSAWTLTDASAVGASYISQDITLTAASYTVSFFVKKTTGAQANYPVVLFYLAATTGLAGVTVDTSNGVATAWTAYTGFTGITGSATCVSYNSTYWRVSLTFIGTAAAWTLRMYPAGTTNPTQSTGTLDLTAQGSAVFYGAQVELGSFASSYIATTTVAVARNADVLTYSGGDIPNLKTLSATFKREVGVSNNGVIASLDDGTASVFSLSNIQTATQHVFQGYTSGATQWNLASSNAYVPGTDSKIAWSAANNDIKMSKDGVAQTQDTSAVLPTTTKLSVGHYGGGSLQLNGNVGGIYGWTRNFSQSELNAVTA